MRAYRAGQAVEDHCRQCHEDRMHTVIVVDGQGQPIRARCDYCGSEHNYRGGPRNTATGNRQPADRTNRTDTATGVGSPVSGTRSASGENPPASPRSEPARSEVWPLVSEHERRYPPMSHDSTTSDLESLLRRVIREESGLTPAAPAEKWRGGQLVLRPGKAGLQEKSWPIETFFHKVVMLRNRLRTLEQQVNGSDLPDDQKVKLQSYITGCYGSLTSFNVLFAEEDDRFTGAAQD
jgi:hypothetical protein